MKKAVFLKKFKAAVEMTRVLVGKEAEKAVESDGCALRYVNEQTADICLKAVERNGYALRYVDLDVFED